METKKHHVSKEDIQHTLHAHFQANKAKDDKTKFIRKHVVSFVQVKTLNTSSSKRMFGSFGNSKCKLLCLTMHDMIENGQARILGQLHYVNFQANYTIDCRKTWSLNDLKSIENCLDDGNNHPQGSFRLRFEDIKDFNEPLQWIVHANESTTAMKEFIWTLFALYVDIKGALPESTFNLQDLSDIAMELKLQSKYNLEFNVAAFQQSPLIEQAGECKTSNENTTAKSPEHEENLSTTLSVEYGDAIALLGNINWYEQSVDSIEQEWAEHLKALEVENIEFLLAFQDKLDHQAMESIINSIDGVLREVKMAEKWTEDAETTLGNTAANMSQFENLNSQMEIHFKNSVALEAALSAIIESVDISHDLMSCLLKPVAIFPSDKQTEENPRTSPALTTQLFVANLPLIVKAIKRLDAAIKSIETYPAKQMTAFRSKKDELITLGNNFSEKLAISFDQYLQSRVKALVQDMAKNHRRSVSSADIISPRKSMHMFGREREISTSTVKDERTRGPSTTSSSVNEEVDWHFRNDSLHRELNQYKELCSSISGRSTTHMRDIYVKHVSQIYGPHIQAVFRSLKEKIPKSKHNNASGLPSKTSGWNINLSFSHATETTTTTTNPSILLQQGLQHVFPLCLTEQAFSCEMFFNLESENTRKVKSDPPELTNMMEVLFEKLLKRLIEFAEAGVHANIMEALSMIVASQQSLASLESKSDFITNTMLNFQLHLKRVFSKYIEEQETWLANMHPDTRLVGVLSPVQKMMNLIARLEDAGSGNHDEAILSPIYERLVVGLFDWLEKAAASKPKYKHLVRLENYHFMHEKFTALCLHGGNSSVIQVYTDRVYEAYTKNLRAYAIWLWECECEKYITLFHSIENLLKTIPVQEVQFHISKQEVRKVVDANNQHLEKAIKHIGDRLKKHLSHTSAMISVVSQSLQNVVMQQQEHFTSIATSCYDMTIEPSKEHAVKVISQVALPAVLTAPIRPDVVTFVHTNMNKNNRQAYAVSRKAGHQHSAESWGTGRAVARIPRISGGGTQRAGQGAFGNMCRSGRMFAPTRIWRKWHRKINVNQRRFAVASALAASAVPSLVLARGHRIEKVSEIPLVLDDSVEATQKTAAAIKILAKIGAEVDVEKVKDSKKVRTGRGKSRNRRYSLKKGPLVVYAHANGIEKAFRNIPGVELAPVERLNLLSLAPGGHVGRFIVWTKSAFEQLDTIYGTYSKKSAVKSDYTLPRHVMSNANLGRLINSDEIQSVVRAGIYKNTRRAHKKNPLKNLGAMVKLNPYTLVARRAELRAEALRKEKKGAIVAAKRNIKTTKNDPKRKAQSKAL
ncbi:hypothetical protein THRCLA_02800, partial [Thraustotheca clavata]